MIAVQKLVLMIQPNRLQSFIWQAVLKSQKIATIQETVDSDLSSSITELKEAGLTLPDLLLIDINQLGFHPYSFCRWCRDTHPSLKVVLTNSAQTEVSLPEKQWAMNQGAADLLPVFQIENLVSSVAEGTKRVLDILDYPEFDNAALVSTLLKMKRELDARRFRETTAVADPATLMGESTTLPPTGPPPSPTLNTDTIPTNPSPPATSEPQPPAAPKRLYRGVFY